MKKELLVLALLCVTLAGCAQSGHHSKVLRGAATVEVLDEKGNPLEGEYACIDFLTLYQGTGQHLDVRKGKSGKDGKFYGEGRGDYDRIATEVGKFALGDGKNARKEYYRSGCRIGTDRNKENTQWEPWNPTVKLHVRKKLNPVPMYAKTVSPLGEKKIRNAGNLKFPNQVAYDLEKGDFCTPEGTGVTRDFIFTIDRSDKGKDALVKLTFSNENDGIALVDPKDPKSCLPPKKVSGFEYMYDFIGPRYAYENGYESEYVWDNLKEDRRWKSNLKDEEERASFYVFRVRTKTNKDGKIEEAKYGKIRKGMRFIVGEDGFRNVTFSYYYNPDGTRNLESDPGKNLFPRKQLNDLEPLYDP